MIEEWSSVPLLPAVVKVIATTPITRFPGLFEAQHDQLKDNSSSKARPRGAEAMENRVAVSAPYEIDVMPETVAAKSYRLGRPELRKTPSSKRQPAGGVRGGEHAQQQSNINMMGRAAPSFIR